MNFAQPEILAWIWLAPLFGLVTWLGQRRRLARLRRIAGPALSGLTPHLGRRFAKVAMVTLALAALIVALARPRWGFEWQDVRRTGADLIIAVDVSQSMLATDVDPSRLERAKRKVSDLLQLLRGDRVGLVAFAGEAFVQCPLTEDYGAVRLFLSYLDTDLIPVQGTDLGGAIRASVKALQDGSADDPDNTQGAAGRAIILITDGEDQDAQAEAAALDAKDRGIKLFTVGIGGDTGAPIPVAGGGFKKDASGNLIMTKPDEVGLKKLAVLTGGAYVHSVTSDEDLKGLYEKGIRAQVAQNEGDTTRKKLWQDRFPWFIGVALVLVLGEFFLSEMSLVALVLLLFCLPGAKPALAEDLKSAHDAYARGDFDTATRAFLDAEVEHPDAPEHAYNRAVSEFRQKRYQEAAQGFARAAEAKDPKLSQRSLYNLGNSEASAGRFDEAIKAYERALKLDPKDQEAKDNLAYAEEAKKQQKQPQQNSDKDKNKDQKDQKESKDQNQSQDAKDGQKGDSKPQQDQKNQDQDQKNQDQKNQDQQQKNQDQNQKQNDAQNETSAKDQQKAPAPGDEQKKADEQKQQQDQQAKADAQKKDEDKASAAQGQTATSTGTNDQPQGQPQDQEQKLSDADAERILRGVIDDPRKFMAPPRDARARRNTGKDW